MAREILFRGQKVDTKEWIFGDLIYEIHCGVAIETPSIHHRENNESTGSFTRIKAKTTGQFTGLTDKNKVKIFEGDIIYFSIDKQEYVVTFKDGAFRLVLNGCIISMCDFRNSEYLIIGNIHEN